MATNFPNSLDNGTSLPYPSASNLTNSPSLASGQDNQNDSLIAIQNKLGITASTPTANNLLMGSGAGTSTWSKLAPAGVLVGTTDVQILTNKTLSSPNIASPVITNATLTTDLISGFTTANSGTVYGVAVTAGVLQTANTIDGASFKPNTIQTAAFANTSVTPSKLSTGAVKNYVATSESTASTTYVALTTAQAISVTIGLNGLLFLTITANTSTSAGASAISYTASGVNTIAASDASALIGTTSNTAYSYTRLLTGLTPGLTTFTLQFRATTGTATFTGREISVLPL